MAPEPLAGGDANAAGLARRAISAVRGGTSWLDTTPCSCRNMRRACNGPAEPFSWSFNLSVPWFPGMGRTRVNRSRNRTTSNYHLGAFSFLKVFLTPSQQGVCAHNTASSCVGPVLITVPVFFPLSGF